MPRNTKHSQGIERLVEKYRREFRIPENINYYDNEDYTQVEKRYVLFRLRNGQASGGGPAR